MSEVLIIDDSDSRVVYSGDWQVGTVVSPISNEYNSTFHQSAGAGDKLSLTFYGTSISVYGTIDTPILRGSPNATFRVDDLPVAYFNSTGSVLVFLDMMNSHVLLYELSGLYKTTHTLTIETLAASNPAARFYIDFFTVSTGSDSAYGYIIVDDRDPSIVYTGAWSDYGIPLEYMSTTKLAPQNGYGGSAMVPFNGTIATVYGTTSNTSGPETVAEVAFFVDGVYVKNFTGSQNASILRHVPFFHVDGLSDTQEHNIVMDTLNSNGWFLDYVVYKTENSTLTGGAGGGDQHVGEAGGGTSSPNAGLIVGAVVAAVVGVAALLVIGFVLVRRYRARRDHESNEATIKAALGPRIEPFENARTQILSPPKSRQTVGQSPTRPLSSAATTSYADGLTSYNEDTPTESHIIESSPHVGQPVPVLQVVAPGTHPYNNLLYPQFDAGPRGATSDPPAESSTEHPNVHDPPMAQGSNVKSVFTNARRVPGPPQTRPPRRPQRSNNPVFEEDSGIRIPVSIPPAYTPD